MSKGVLKWGLGSNKKAVINAVLDKWNGQSQAMSPDNPLNSKGKKIMTSMVSEYGAKKGKKIFYASKNKGTIKGVD